MDLEVRKRSNASITFTQAKNDANYCLSKAKSLKAGTSIKVIQSPQNDYSRWYKITNTQKKKIYIWSNGLSSYSSKITIYNAKGKKIETIAAGSDTKYCTKTAQEKGTYYIRVHSTGDNYKSPGYVNGEVITLKWK